MLTGHGRAEMVSLTIYWVTSKIFETLYGSVATGRRRVAGKGWENRIIRWLLQWFKVVDGKEMVMTCIKINENRDKYKQCFGERRIKT